MYPLRQLTNIVRLPTSMPKNTPEADAGDVARKCEMTLVGTLGVKAKGVGTDADVLMGTEVYATAPGMGPGRSTHKCDPPVAACNTGLTNTPKQRPWKETRHPAPA